MGPAEQRRPAPELRADLQSDRHDDRRRTSAECSSSPTCTTRPSSSQAMTPAAFAAFRAAELAPGQTTVHPDRRHGDRLGRCWSPARSSRRWTAARGDGNGEAEGGFGGLANFPALLAGRAGAVRLRRRAGRRVELPDPLHAAQFPGHARKRRAALAADLVRNLLRRALHRHAADVAREPGEAARRFRGDQRGAVPGRGRRWWARRPLRR